jgi:catechol 2,3-dioxygenase-like lactoylglutathione lyase family enzyme
MLSQIFGWDIRWEGASMDNGYTVHVGSAESYIALYATGDSRPSSESSYKTIAGLNHIALTVDDLDAVETRVLEAGFKTENHGEYEPGRRFYFRDTDHVEYEIVSYS